MTAALRDAMSRRFSDIGSLALFLAATQIDPRFKDTYFTVQEQAATKNVILESGLSAFSPRIGYVQCAI